MKKLLRIIVPIITIAIFVFILLAIGGSKDSAKEEEIAKQHMSDSISYSGTLENLSTLDKEKMKELVLNKHIKISGVVEKIASNYILLTEDDFTIKAYYSEPIENISENTIVTVDGVCTYVSSDNIRLRGAFIGVVTERDDTNEKKDEVATESVTENTPEDSDESTIDDEVTEIVLNIYPDVNIDKILYTDEKGLVVKVSETDYYSTLQFDTSMAGAHLSDELANRAAKLSEKNKAFDGMAGVVYVDGQDTPSYYVSLEAHTLSDIYISYTESGNLFCQYIRHDKDLMEDFKQFYKDSYKYLQTIYDGTNSDIENDILNCERMLMCLEGTDGWK